MLRSLVRLSASVKESRSSILVPAIATSSYLSSYRSYATKKAKSSSAKGANNKSNPKSKTDAKSKSKSKVEEVAAAAGDDSAADAITDEEIRARGLAEDEKDKSLDIGPNGRPLFTSAASISQLTRKDACSYMKFR